MSHRLMKVGLLQLIFLGEDMGMESVGRTRLPQLPMAKLLFNCFNGGSIPSQSFGTAMEGKMASDNNLSHCLFPMLPVLPFCMGSFCLQNRSVCHACVYSDLIAVITYLAVGEGSPNACLTAA